MRPFFLGLFLAAVSALACAQSADFDRSRLPIANLTGPWRFHTGDDPRWSNPAFDDSSWSLLDAGKPWSDQGYSGYTGAAWYRLSVTLPANLDHIAFYLPDIDDGGQVFANGHLIGQVGGMPPRPRYIVHQQALFTIPPEALVPGHPLNLAIRAWRWSGNANVPGGGLTSVPSIGDAAILDNRRQLDVHDAFWQNGESSIELCIYLFTMLAGIGLFLLRRSERHYLVWGLSQLCWTGYVACFLYQSFFPASYAAIVVLVFSLYSAGTWLQAEFYRIFLRQPRGWLFRGVVFSILLSAAAALVKNLGPGNGLASFASSFFSAVTQLCIVAMLWIGVRRRHPDAALLLVPNCFMAVFNVLEALSVAPGLASRPWAAAIANFFAEPAQWPFPLVIGGVLADLELLAVFVILVRSYARSRRDEERLAGELEAARVVQQVLIPTDIPSIPGFNLQTVYKPASEVGGDFFQIIPLDSGGALIAVGDVSGKGMPAAMTVSLLVGTFRTLAHFTQSPAEILAAMNQRMLSRSQGGFTTCLVLRLDPDHALTVANAGHLAPYLGGQELSVNNGLPLGLSADSSYPETTTILPPNARLSLVTDGVVEAQSPSGELFGFDRTRQISTQSAEHIAHAAQSYGQQDDITVLTLTFASAEVLHA